MLLTTVLNQITDVNSTEFRCYELDMNATPGQTSIATVEAGSTIGFKGRTRPSTVRYLS